MSEIKTTNNKAYHVFNDGRILNAALSKPEQTYILDLAVRLDKDIDTFVFSDTDKYALQSILNRILPHTEFNK